MINTLLKLEENDKKFIIAILLIFILVFVIIGCLALFIKKIMKIQGSKSDALLHDVVKAEYFEKEKQLVKFGIRKNIRLFYKQARVPFFIMAGAWLLFLGWSIITERWGYNPFNKDDGFATILFEFGEWPTTPWFDIRIISGWPEVIRYPKFVAEAWMSYIFVPANVIGAIWFLICTQAYIARSIRIYQIGRGIYRKKLTPDEPASN